LDSWKIGFAAVDESAGNIAVRVVLKLVGATVEDFEVALSLEKILLNVLEGFETLAAKTGASDCAALEGPIDVRSPDRRMNEAW
jgi:hypothetical protein